MKPKQPVPKPVKMWAWVHDGKLKRTHIDRSMLTIFTDACGGKIIRVTVTPEPTKARDK